MGDTVRLRGGFVMRSLETTDELMPANHKDMLPECESPSNTESDRDPNTDELPSKPAEGDNESSDEEPAAGEGLSEEVYEVEKILDHDETKEGLFYLVHWKGFTEEDDSWEPAENLVFATKAIAEYESTRKAKSKKCFYSVPKVFRSRRRTRQKASAEKSESEPEPEIPSDDIEDEDFTEKPKSSKKSSTLPPKGSGTVTKAALKSYSPTTPKVRRGSTSTSTYVSPSETMSAAKKDFEVKPDQMQALLMRQSWLYDSDSDDDSGTEKENEKKMEQLINTTTSSASAPSTSIADDTPQEEVQIFAIGKVNDGRIRVVIGNDQAKKVVSLRDAHDANSWGLLQHLLQYAVFDDFDD
ncbi:unnamed protein product [Haemonchus placei]|uniref:Chromo domain-containing protein n=1 Tax=Haemonchus placei TaxID=6290 RepID=A0A0N4X0Y9_HAEPC|nr:unnamed protein product [Haemonchus placei]